MTLLKQQAKSEGLSLLIWGVALGGLVLYSVTLWKTLMESEAMDAILQMLEGLPPALQAMIGGSSAVMSLSGWVQVYAFGSWILIPYLVFTGLFAAGLISREMDRRTMEFLLALPTSRTQLLLSRWSGMALGLGLLQLLHWGAVVMGVLLIGEQPDYLGFAVAELNLWLLLLGLATLFLLLTLFIDDFGRAVGATLGLGFGLYFLHILGEGQGGVVERVRDWLPFAQFKPEVALLEGSLPTGSLLYLGLLTLVALLLSVLCFNRKEIAV